VLAVLYPVNGSVGISDPLESNEHAICIPILAIVKTSRKQLVHAHATIKK